MLKKSIPLSTKLSFRRIGNQPFLLHGKWQSETPRITRHQTALSPTNVSNASQQVESSSKEQQLFTHYAMLKSEEQRAVGSMESWRLLLKQLSTIVGSEGSAAIFFHCIGQLSSQYPTLRTLSPHHSWPEQLAIVQNTLQPLPQSSAAFARQSLWFRGCQLLTKLLGESLSRRLLHQVAAAQSTEQHG
jgi:hypothetical protein